MSMTTGSFTGRVTRAVVSLATLLPAACMLVAPLDGGAEPSRTTRTLEASAAAQDGTDLNNRGVKEAQAGHFEAGAQLLREAVQRSPADQQVRKNLSGVLTDWSRQLARQGQPDRAMATLQEAVEHDSTNGMAFVLLGDLQYLQQSNIPAAIEAWRRAYGNVPASVWQAVANRLSQAQRDQVIESEFVAKQTAHFGIRFQKSSAIDVEQLGRLLERVYARLSQGLGSCPSRLTVIIYTDADLRRTYYQRDWAVGFYDGRIRLRVDELVQTSLEDMAAHELAHAFLHHQYGNHLPTWVHEGYAQLQERSHPQTDEVARIEQGVVSRALWIPLKWLDRHFEQPSGIEDVARSYIQSRLVVGELVKRYGMGRFTGFLEHLAHGVAIDAAYDLAFAPSRWARADQGILE